MLLTIQEREEREEIERELKAQNDSLNLSGPLGGSQTPPSLRRTPTPGLNTLKEPLPMGLAGLEAFRREYLTSPLSHLKNTPTSLLPPNFPPFLPSATMNSIAESSFGRGLTAPPPAPSSSSGSATPPAGGGAGGGGHSSAHRSPSSEFTSQQNWSFEEQFKQVSVTPTMFLNCHVP